MVNRVVLIGRLTRDPELRTTTTGKSVCSFSIAVNKRFKPQDGSPDADFFRVSAWDSTAEFVANYLTKGRLCAVDGRLQSRKYTASDGTNREVVEVVADIVQGLDRPREDAGGVPATREAEPVAVAAAPNVDEYDPFADE
jgi:single-strand DNA-binding protein